MKELSIEEKAKRYDEKLDAARHIYTDPSVKEEDKYYIEVIFPELAESEDERIRKALIKYFTLSDDNADYQCCGVHYKDIVAWLEKQGEISKEWSEMKVANIQTELQKMVNLKQKTEQVEQKAAWSEGDEKLVKNLISTLSNLYARNLIEKETKEKYTNLLKSLKNRYTWKPTEEQMVALDGICSYIRNNADWEISLDMIAELYKLSEQLKKLMEE